MTVPRVNPLPGGAGVGLFKDCFAMLAMTVLTVNPLPGRVGVGLFKDCFATLAMTVVKIEIVRYENKGC